MIGALPWDPPAERPGWLDEIDRPIVLVTTSSEYQADWAHGEAGGALVRAALDGLRDEPFEVVATMPAGIQGLGTLPANARVLDFVPHRHVLDRTVVAVTHGGMGATQKALARGIPGAWCRSGATSWRSPPGPCRPTRAPAYRPSGSPERLRDAVREAATKREGAAGSPPATRPPEAHPPGPTRWRLSSPPPDADLGQPAGEVRALGRVRAQLHGGPVCLDRLRDPAGPPQQVGPGGLVGVVAVEPVDGLQRHEAGRRPVALGQRHGPVERDDGVGVTAYSWS